MITQNALHRNETVRAIKARAHEIKQESGIPHMKALDPSRTAQSRSIG